MDLLSRRALLPDHQRDGEPRPTAGRVLGVRQVLARRRRVDPDRARRYIRRTFPRPETAYVATDQELWQHEEGYNSGGLTKWLDSVEHYASIRHLRIELLAQDEFPVGKKFFWRERS